MAIDVTDVSGNNMHLSNNGDVIYESEGLTSFYSFDGTNSLSYSDETAEEFNILGSESYVGDKGLTLMCWARKTDVDIPAGTEVLVGKSNTPSNQQYRLVIASNGFFFQVSTTGSAYISAQVGNSLFTALDTWNFFCGRWSAGSTVDAFVNDDKVVGAVVSAPLFVGDGVFRIGAESNAGVASSFFVGDISKVGVYASALTDDQIFTIYEMTAPMFKPNL